MMTQQGGRPRPIIIKHVFCEGVVSCFGLDYNSPRAFMGQTRAQVRAHVVQRPRRSLQLVVWVCGQRGEGSLDDLPPRRILIRNNYPAIAPLPASESLTIRDLVANTNH